MADRKEEVGNKERELKDGIYLSSSPSDSKETSSILKRAKQNYDSGEYLTALINTSTYIELLLRRALAEANKKDYSRVPFHALLREGTEQNLFGRDTIMKLKDFWPVRNRAIHEGLTPSKNDTKNLIDVANLLERDLSFRLESSPILTERDRRLIATRFMKRLCELDLQTRQESIPNKFSIEEIWRGNLDDFNLTIVAPYAIAFMQGLKLGIRWQGCYP